MAQAFHITASYAFVPLERARLDVLRDQLVDFGHQHGMLGLVLLATEGVNATVSGTQEAIAEWKLMLAGTFGEMPFKDSIVDRPVFKHWSVKIKSEIVALKSEGVVPHGKRRHLAPREWQAVLESEDVVLLDTRNDYEYAVGKFTGALGGATKSFSEFPEYVRSAALPKDKKILIYCTGGIRCEKALIEMERQGYDNVYQLDGGILAYLEQFPDAAFEGECFVFDHRVAVDGRLRATTAYDLCPHCGHAGDRPVLCHCGKRHRVCGECHARDERRTCSKRCANEAVIVASSATTGKY